ncbi:MAG: response regulator [Defluviitaleaceae bacterium]|nr:response regulator [Defluviitaleaceae bacterium]
MKKDDDAKRVACKQRLLQITDLNADTIKEMSDEALLNYTETLGTSIGAFPIQKEKCEDAFEKANYSSMVQWLRAIRNNLTKIHADALARDCDKQIFLNQDIENIRRERLKGFLGYFLVTATMLFEDIAQVFKELELQSDSGESASAGAASPYNVIRNNLSALSDLEQHKIEQMTDEQLQTYIDILHAFPDSYTPLENSLRGAMKIRNYTLVLKGLATIEGSLSKIFATGLAEDCKSQIQANRDVNSIRHEKLEAFTNYFLSSVAMLADDVRGLNLASSVSKEPEQAPEAEKPPVLEILSPGASKNSKKILITNKSKLFMENLRVALDGTGYRIYGAATGKDSLDYIRTAPAKPNLVILDDDLPDMDSWELAKKIRESGHNVPIIFLASNITKEYMVKAMTAGVADFIIKPIASKNVREKVAKFLVK